MNRLSTVALKHLGFERGPVLYHNVLPPSHRMKVVEARKNGHFWMQCNNLGTEGPR